MLAWIHVYAYPNVHVRVRESFVSARDYGTERKTTNSIAIVINEHPMSLILPASFQSTHAHEHAHSSQLAGGTYPQMELYTYT